LFQNTLVAYGLCAFVWLYRYPRWYWIVPLLVLSILVMVGAIIYWPCLILGVIGFAAALQRGGAAADMDVAS